MPVATPAEGIADRRRPADQEDQEEVRGIAEPGTSEPVVAEGDLDLLGAPALGEAIAARLERGETSLVVDLSRCEFVDSVGLSLLLTTRERCLALGGSFRVIGLSDNVRTLLRTVGVLDLLVSPPAPAPTPPPA